MSYLTLHTTSKTNAMEEKMQSIVKRSDQEKQSVEQKLQTEVKVSTTTPLKCMAYGVPSSLGSRGMKSGKKAKFPRVTTTFWIYCFKILHDIITHLTFDSFNSLLNFKYREFNFFWVEYYTKEHGSRCSWVTSSVPKTIKVSDS